MPADRAERTLEDVLEAIEDFDSASFGLIAWELVSSEAAIEPIWHRAVQQRLLRATGATDLGEPTYQLTWAGRTRLRELRSSRSGQR
jgi:DNA-binding PadR family transcriptional regulator